MLVSFGARDVETDDGREQVFKAFVKCAKMAGRGALTMREGYIMHSVRKIHPFNRPGSLTAGGLPVSFQTLGDQY